MSLAILHFLEQQNQVSMIVQKFGTPGHSATQEIDNLHRKIEKTMTHSEVFSPVGLLWVLKLVNRKKPLRIIQLQNRDFLEFQHPAKLLRFNQIPYSQVQEIQYCGELQIVWL